jgi:hypothetical protein
VGKKVLDLLDELYTSHHTQGDVSARVAERAGALRDKLRQAAKATTEEEDGATSEGSDTGEVARLAKKKKQQSEAVLPAGMPGQASAAPGGTDVHMS